MEGEVLPFFGERGRRCLVVACTPMFFPYRVDEKRYTMAGVINAVVFFLEQIGRPCGLFHRPER